LLSAPAETRLLLIAGQDAAFLRAAARTSPRVVLAMLALDDASRAAIPAMRAAFAQQECWREHPALANLAAYENLCRE